MPSRMPSPLVRPPEVQPPQPVPVADPVLPRVAGSPPPMPFRPGTAAPGGWPAGSSQTAGRMPPPGAIPVDQSMPGMPGPGLGYGSPFLPRAGASRHARFAAQPDFFEGGAGPSGGPGFNSREGMHPGAGLSQSREAEELRGEPAAGAPPNKRDI